jgi:hypothetical protein
MSFSAWLDWVGAQQIGFIIARQGGALTAELSIAGLGGNQKVGSPLSCWPGLCHLSIFHHD